MRIPVEKISRCSNREDAGGLEFFADRNFQVLADRLPGAAPHNSSSPPGLGSPLLASARSVSSAGLESEHDMRQLTGMVELTEMAMSPTVWLLVCRRHVSLPSSRRCGIKLDALIVGKCEKAGFVKPKLAFVAESKHEVLAETAGL